MHFVVMQMKGGILKAKLGKRTLARSPHFETPHLSHREERAGTCSATLQGTTMKLQGLKSVFYNIIYIIMV